MRNHKNHVVLGAALGALLVAGTLWAGEAKSSLPLIKAGKKAQQVRLSKAAATNVSAVSQAIVDEIDWYQNAVQASYHSKVTDPSVPWHEKCRLAIAHGRLNLLRTDIGGSLGGTREVGTSILRVHLLCPEEIAVLDIPADFEVHTAPHPEEIVEMSFDTQMHSIEGVITDTELFSSFHLVGGTAHGYESNGHTTLLKDEAGNLAVDSTFNIGYRVEFTGAEGGPLEGASGSTEGSILMKAYGK